ncbi:hypothetical protein M595_1456 [Lyngbya aestuarii BL J]|uniref:DUF4278 domain-containing protein n=1 Tax=Lyngbya aestuarii BL J TaxID=1348334 RepID=U7QNG4_9CYAN|nr:DUF4278 domain-containing protein [Lyngbya aestuarii]ERT08665.1 hypothetical protein M595_1456 [Lyngbya aestuarii BL J]
MSKLTYRGISYTTDNTAIETAVTAKYRGQTYTITNTPAVSTAKTLTYRGISYNTKKDAVSQPSTLTFPTNILPEFV